MYLHVSVKQKASATRSTLQGLGKLSLRAGGRSETKTADTANIVFQQSQGGNEAKKNDG